LLLCVEIQVHNHGLGWQRGHFFDQKLSISYAQRETRFAIDAGPPLRWT
jgi:hypothetical protein